jgi:hypothetical protein
MRSVLYFPGLRNGGSAPRVDQNPSFEGMYSSRRVFARSLEARFGLRDQDWYMLTDYKSQRNPGPHVHRLKRKVFICSSSRSYTSHAFRKRNHLSVIIKMLRYWIFRPSMPCTYDGCSIQTKGLIGRFPKSLLSECDWWVLHPALFCDLTGQDGRPSNFSSLKLMYQRSRLGCTV